MEIEDIQKLLRTREYSYIDIKNKLNLSEEEYYKMVELDVNEWRIRSTNLSFTQLQKIKAKQLYDEGNSVHEIAEEMRTVARNVSETLKGYGFWLRVILQAS